MEWVRRWIGKTAECLARAAGNEAWPREHGYRMSGCSIPDPVALATLFVAIVGTAYHVLTYRVARQSSPFLTIGRRAKRRKQLASLAAELLALRAQFLAVENFLLNSTGSILREFRFSYGDASLVFRDAPQMREYVNQVNALIKHYSAVLRKTVAIIEEFEGESLNLPADFTQKIVDAKEALNQAQFRSHNVGEAIDSALKALEIINEALISASGRLA